MAESVATMLRGASTAARTVTVKVKFKDLSLQTRSHTLDRPIATGGAIGQVAAALLAGIDPGEGIRLLGVSASGLNQRGRWTSSPSTWATGRTREPRAPRRGEQSWHDVTAAVDAIRTRFGRARGLGRHGDRGGRAGAGPTGCAVGARVRLSEPSARPCRPAVP